MLRVDKYLRRMRKGDIHKLAHLIHVVGESRTQTSKGVSSTHDDWEPKLLGSIAGFLWLRRARYSQTDKLVHHLWQENIF